MQRVPISKCRVVDTNWVVYRNEDGMDKYTDLSACANNFSLNVGKDSFICKNCIGWYYQEGNNLFCELFNIGHLLIYASVKPTLFEWVPRCFKKQNFESKSERLFRVFVDQLNQAGWSIVNKSAYWEKKEM